MGPTPILQRTTASQNAAGNQRIVQDVRLMNEVEYEDDIMDLFAPESVSQAVKFDNIRHIRSHRIHKAIRRQRRNRATDQAISRSRPFPTILSLRIATPPPPI